MSMTPEQLERINATAAVVVADSETFSERFYAHLFAADPEARELFPADMSAQRGKLVDEVTFLVSAAQDLDTFVDRARALGARHRGYGVRTPNYQSVEIALLAALSDVLGASWNASTRLAWRRLYRLISETMLEGASEELFSDR